MNIILNRYHKKPRLGSRGNHLHFLSRYLTKKANFTEVFNFFELLNTIRSNVGKTSKILIYPNDLFAILVCLALCLVYKLDIYVISWRMGTPNKLKSKVKYFVELILISAVGNIVCICPQQFNTIGRLARNKIYIPPLTTRNKVKGIREQSAWCPGGADRNENGFIEFVKSKSLKGFRTSRDDKVLSCFKQKVLGSECLFYVGDYQKESRLDVEQSKYIYLDCINKDNPAGLTALYENMTLERVLILSDYMSEMFEGMHVVDIDKHVISHQVKTFKNSVIKLS